MIKLLIDFNDSIHATLDKLPFQTAMAVKFIISGYIPYPVRLIVEGGSHNQWIAELRVVNILFIRVKGLKYQGESDLDEVLGKGLLKSLHLLLYHFDVDVVKGVQQMLYRYEGTLCRFIVDDKGSGLLVAFGLPPAKHENDPLRAVKSSIAIVKKMRELGKSAR